MITVNRMSASAKLSALAACCICSLVVACDESKYTVEEPDGSTDSDTDVDSDSDTDADADSDTDTDADSDADSDSDTDTDVDTDVDSDSDTDSDTDTGTESASDSPWVAIEGGTFMMGSDDFIWCEEPVHEVDVPAFDITRSEITVAQYMECVDAAVCTEPSTASDFECNTEVNTWGSAGNEDHPVNCVDWNQATTYCEWLGGRLPSEAEWEYAARSGGEVTNFPWGDEEASCDYAVMNDEYPNTDVTFWGCDTGETWPVCSKPTGNTDHGLCDMSGNIMEWNADDYHNTYEGAPTDGSAWTDSPSTKVIRGGSYYSGWDSVRTTWRGASVWYGYAMTTVGIRCARDAE